MSSGEDRALVDLSDLSTSERYKFLISAIVPRPIAWVTSTSAEGALNLAPFSFFQGVSADPPTLMLSVATSKRSGERKDTLGNVEQTGEFVVNVVNEELLDPMVLSSVEYGAATSEIEVAGLETFPSRHVTPPCLADSPVNMECRLIRTVELGGCVVLFGEILVAHVRRDHLDEKGRVDADRLRPVARLGGAKYALYGRSVDKVTPERG